LQGGKLASGVSGATTLFRLGLYNLLRGTGRSSTSILLSAIS
jgi:hypothetical protein